MPTDRYYCDQELLASNEISLEGTEHHHLRNVMRGAVGDVVELVNGRGALATASVLKLDKRSAQLEIREIETELEPGFEIVIAQAMPRANRLDSILEKGTELGMTHLWLFPGERSENKQLHPSKEKRIKTVMISAMKQCGRLFLPQLVIKPPLNQWDNDLDYSAFFGDLRADKPLFLEEFSKCELTTGALFCVGPESGFSSKEVEKLDALGMKGVKLHNNILRTDTAPLVALSLIHHAQFHKAI